MLASMRRIGLAALAAAVVATCVYRAAAAPERWSLVRHGADGTSAAVQGVVGERLVAVVGAEALGGLGRLRDPEASAVPLAMTKAYARMELDVGDVASPAAVSGLPPAPPGAFDVLTFEVAPPAVARGAVVFLHGYGGPFALPCWQVSRAASAAGFVTLCPSSDVDAAWWTPAGRALVAHTIEIARARGFAKVHLVGLSNGALGASRLAPRLRGSIASVTVISGGAPDAPSPGVPVLALQGRADAMSPANLARAYAKKSGGRYVEIEGGHFGLVTHERAYLEPLEAFLRER
jgi:pimeloyl-ACP methyl ester carboxylesterase